MRPSFLILAICASLLYACDKPVPPSPLDVSDDPWAAKGSGETGEGAAVFASCASCHDANGSGRGDGSIPRLAGQLAPVIERKLQDITSGQRDLPAMLPFARSLSPNEVSAVAEYIAKLPEPGRAATSEVLPAPTTASLCMACHGARGEGNAALLAPRICGQHGPYIARRMAEVMASKPEHRGAPMAAVMASIPPSDWGSIASYYANMDCSGANDGH